MSTFITGATGYLGSYVVHELLEGSDETLELMVRAKSQDQAVAKLWKALQLHVSPERFYGYLDSGRVRFVPGDLHQPGLGLSPEDRARVAREATSVLHIAASLNRKSAKSCFNTNLRGTLSVLKLAREIAETGEGLRRFSNVSTSAIAGKRNNQNVHEDEALDWELSDYDPYARTKKFTEHMTSELLPDVSTVTFRPASVVGDSRFPETTQFDMARVMLLIDLPLVPLDPDVRIDLVPADWTGKAIATIHQQDAPAHDIYHLSAGLDSPTIREICAVLEQVRGRRIRFAPQLHGTFERAISFVAGLKSKSDLTLMAALLEVFLPYVQNDVVFDNTRAVEVIGKPASFTTYCPGLYRFCRKHNWKYPYVDLPPRASEAGSKGPKVTPMKNAGAA